MKDIGQVPLTDDRSDTSCFDEDIFERNYLTEASGAKIIYLIKQRATTPGKSQGQQLLK